MGIKPMALTLARLRSNQLSYICIKADRKGFEPSCLYCVTGRRPLQAAPRSMIKITILRTRQDSNLRWSETHLVNSQDRSANYGNMYKLKQELRDSNPHVSRTLDSKSRASIQFRQTPIHKIKERKQQDSNLHAVFSDLQFSRLVPLVQLGFILPFFSWNRPVTIRYFWFFRPAHSPSLLQFPMWTLMGLSH